MEVVKRYIDEYGFDTLVVTTSEGGRVSISNYGGSVDIGGISIMSPYGMGVSNYIRNKDDVDRHISSMRAIQWFDNSKQRIACTEFLESIRDTAQ